MKFKTLFGLLLIIFPILSFASATSSLGDFAGNLLEPVNIISDFVDTAALIVGGSCLFGALIRYLQYRTNPLAYPISTVVVLFIVGLVLVLLPFLYKLTGAGIPYPSS